MNSALENLKARGFYAQCSNEEELSRLMDSGPITFYLGVDPTGPSAHIGHMVPFFAFRHLLNDGHKGIALMGDGMWSENEPPRYQNSRK